MPKTKATTKADRSYDAIVIGGGHNGLDQRRRTWPRPACGR